MAWVEKYKVGTRDLADVQCLIKFFEDDFIGDITTFTGAGNLIEFEFCNESDDVFDTIKETRVKITVIARTTFALNALYSTENMHFLVDVYFDADDSAGILYWTGWVDPKSYKEAYDITPYAVEITCIDGLSLLKDILFADQDSALDTEYYNGRKLESQIILDILGKIGYTEFKEYVGLYEQEMDDTTADSPMDQITIDVDVFKDKYCDEVLRELLKKYNACIRQKDGIMCIYRPVDSANATVYGHLFTTSTAKTAINFVPDQFIKRSIHNTVFKQVSGGDKIIQDPMRKITVIQDYGYKDSWLDNWQLKGITNRSGVWDYWYPAGGAEPIGFVIPGESDGAGFAAVVAEPPNVYNLWQLYGFHAIIDTKSYNLEFDFIFNNISGSVISGVSIWLELKSITNGHYLYTYDENELRWDVAQNYVTLTVDAPVGISGWTTFKRTLFQGIPETGQYGVKILGLHSPGSLSVSVGIKNVKFYAVSDELSIKKIPTTGERFFWWIFKGTQVKAHEERSVKDVEEVVIHEYIKINDINGGELGYDCMLGDVLNVSTPASDADTNIDNILEQFAGALSIVWSLVKTIAQFITDHAADYNPAGTGHVILSQGTGVNTNDLILTAETAGHNFVGNTTITNTSGDLTGSVVATQANAANTYEVNMVALTGSSGSCLITCDGLAKTLNFYGVTPATTAQAFVDDFYDDYDDIHVTVSRVLATIVFTDQYAFPGFSGNTTISNLSGNLDGTVTERWADPAQKRIDTITLSGGTGTANILCDGVTQKITANTIPSTAWHKGVLGSDGESIPLLDLISDEIKEQYSRPKELIQMPIQDIGTGIPSLNLLGNLQDSMNQVNGVNRKFVINRGTYNVRMRQWNLDLVEII